MLRLFFLSLFILTLLLSTANSKENVVCLFGSWAVYYKGKAQFSIEEAVPALSVCTHLIYAYVGLDNKTNEIISRDPYADFYENYGLGGIHQYVDLKKNNSDVKFLVGIGGWVEGSVKFSDMAAVKFKRDKFVKSVSNFLKKYNLDGMDIAWSYPGQRGGKQYDKENFVQLVKELKAEFDKNNWVLSVTVPHTPIKLRKGFDIKELSQLVHFFNVLSYEYHHFESSRVQPSNPLRSKDGEDVESTINLLRDSGAPPGKLNLGLTAITVTFKLKKNINESDHVVNQSTLRQGIPSKYLQSSGYISYNEICMLQSHRGWFYKWDEDSSTPFLINGNKVISFDDPRSVKEKVAFAKKKKLGGIFFNRIDLDDFSKDCKNSEYKFPLLNAIKNEFEAGKPNVKLETEKKKLENETVTMKNETVKIENEPVKTENKTIYLENEETKSKDEIISSVKEGAPTHDRRVVCYMARWGLFLNGNGKFDIGDAELALPMCTHLVYNFVVLDETSFKMKSADPFRDFTEKDYSGGLGGIAKTVRLKQKYSHLKVMVGLGGWDEGSIKYSHMASIKARRKTFIQSAVEFLKYHKLDGVDFNWQFPGDRGGSPADKGNLVLLAKEIREEFDKHGFIISFAVSSFPYRISLGIDPENLSKHAHFLNVLSYEYHGFWESKVGVGAPLRAVKDNMNIEATIDLYETLKTPPDKINLGLSNYGMTFFLIEKINDTSIDINNKPAQGFGFKGPYNNVDGFMGYNELCLMLEDPSWKVIKHEPSATKFAINGDRVVSFDDAETYMEKVKFAMKRKLGGFIYYSLEKDDFRNDCKHTEKYPLLTKIDASIYQYSDLLYEDLLELMKTKNAHYFWRLGDSSISETSP